LRDARFWVGADIDNHSLSNDAARAVRFRVKISTRLVLLLLLLLLWQLLRLRRLIDRGHALAS